MFQVWFVTTANRNQLTTALPTSQVYRANRTSPPCPAREKFQPQKCPRKIPSLPLPSLFPPPANLAASNPPEHNKPFWKCYRNNGAGRKLLSVQQRPRLNPIPLPAT